MKDVLKHTILANMYLKINVSYRSNGTTILDDWQSVLYMTCFCMETDKMDSSWESSSEFLTFAMEIHTIWTYLVTKLIYGHLQHIVQLVRASLLTDLFNNCTCLGRKSGPENPHKKWKWWSCMVCQNSEYRYIQNINKIIKSKYRIDKIEISMTPSHLYMVHFNTNNRHQVAYVLLLWSFCTLILANNCRQVCYSI